MRTQKYKWLTLGLASIVISGCAVGSQPKLNLNLGIADALRKSRDSLTKKKLSYKAPDASSKFGFSNPSTSAQPTRLPSIGTLPSLKNVPLLSGRSSASPVSESSSVLTSDCGCTGNNAASTMELDTPTGSSAEPVAPPLHDGSEYVDSVPPAILPFEDSASELGLENPLPPAVEMPATELVPSGEMNHTSPDEEEGTIETLDSAAHELDNTNELLDVTPKKDENSILETAAKALEGQIPTSAGHSVVEQRSKMLVLTARPAESHQVFDRTARVANKSGTQLVTHKRHFRQQNALRPRRSPFRSEAIEHTAEAPAPVKFKPLPVLPPASHSHNATEKNTGAPKLNRQPASKPQEGTLEIRRLPEADGNHAPAAKRGNIIKTARLPILKTETTAAASIGSLRNFTNVRDLDADYYRRKKEEITTIKAATSANASTTTVRVPGSDSGRTVVR